MPGMECHSFMKPFIYSLAVIVFFINCKKDQTPINNETLIGSWDLIDVYTSTNSDNPVHRNGSNLTIFRFTPTDSLYRIFHDIYVNTKLLDISDTTFLADDNPLSYRYSIRGDVLDIFHPQDNGTRYVFKKITR